MASVRIACLSIFLMTLPLTHVSAQVQSTVSSALPSLPGGEKEQAKAGGSEDNIYCRPPQPLTDSRLMGPKVCKPVREWNALHAGGLDVDAHGDVRPMQNLSDLKNR